jgi:hypothetical protein
MNAKVASSVVLGAAVFAISAPQAHANAELEILVNGSPVYDSGAVAGSSGTITQDYSSGSISVDASALWTGNSMDLDNIDVNGAGHVQIIFSDNNNTPPGGLAVLGVSGHDVSGSLNGNVKAYWSQSNALLAQTTLVASQSTLLGDQDTWGTIHADDAYSLTEVVTISSGRGTISTDDSVTVPDGGMTVGLLGGAMSVLALVRSKFSKLA